MKTDLLDILFYTYIPDYSSGHLIFSPKHLHPHTSTHQHLNTYTTHTPLIPWLHIAYDPAHLNMSICTRKRDWAYLLFFVTHVPIILRMILYLYLHTLIIASHICMHTHTNTQHSNRHRPPPTNLSPNKPLPRPAPLLHNNLPRQILRRSPNMVHRLHLDGTAVPPPTLHMGYTGFA